MCVLCKSASVPDHELHNGVFRSISSHCMRLKIFLFFLPNSPTLCNTINHRTIFPGAHSGLCKWRLESLSTVQSKRFSAIVEFSQEPVRVKHPAWKIYLHSGRSGRSSSGSWPTHWYFFLPSLTCNHIFQVHLSPCHTQWCITLKKAKQVITFPQSSAVERSDLIWSWGAMKWHRKYPKVEHSPAGRGGVCSSLWNNQHRHTIHLSTGSLVLPALGCGTWLHYHGRYIFELFPSAWPCDGSPGSAQSHGHSAPSSSLSPRKGTGLFQAFIMENIFSSIPPFQWLGSCSVLYTQPCSYLF